MGVPNKNSVARLKSNILAPQNSGLATPLDKNNTFNTFQQYVSAILAALFEPLTLPV